MDTAKRQREECMDKARCLAYIKRLWEADVLAMFHHPVSATEVPGYYDVIDTPMDLSTIKKKVEEGKYQSDADVQDDVAIMISNALDFNEKGSAWHDQARQFRRDYIKLAQQAGLTVDEDSAFIPTKKFKDEEKTLRQAEKYEEKLEDVLGDLEKEKNIPLDELRAKYARPVAVDGDDASHASSASASDASSNADDEEDDEEDEFSSDDDDDDDEDGSSSDGSSSDAS